MNKDLELIRRDYGYEMARLCKIAFPYILRKEGKLYKLMNESFYPTKELIEDLVRYNLVGSFIKYIKKLSSGKKSETNFMTPIEHLENVGYQTYCIVKKDDIEKIKACTDINDDEMYYFIKNNVSFDSENPPSILLSVRNNQIDAKGYLDYFEKKVNVPEKPFSIPGYIKTNDGKYYPCKDYGFFNMPKGIKYGPDNIIIDDGHLVNYFYIYNFRTGEKKTIDLREKDKYILIDYFILDIENKKMYLYDKRIEESFHLYFQDIDEIEVTSIENGKEIKVFKNGNLDIVMKLDENSSIKELEMLNAKRISHYFLKNNKRLTNFSIPNAEEMGTSCLKENEILEELYAPKLRIMYSNCFEKNKRMETLGLQSLTHMNSGCFNENNRLKRIYIPNLRNLGERCFQNNKVVEYLYFPHLEIAGYYCFEDNNNLKAIYLQERDYVPCGFYKFLGAAKIIYIDSPQKQNVKKKIKTNHE